MRWHKDIVHGKKKSMNDIRKYGDKGPGVWGVFESAESSDPGFSHSSITPFRERGVCAVRLLMFMLCLCSVTDSQAAPFRRGRAPNIVMIMADDLGYGDLGCYGNTVVKTPNLDAMSLSGIRFERFYAAAPVCSPTRGSSLTGRHPYRYGMTFAGRYGLPAEEVTLAEALKSKGYATAHFGKWHVGGLSRMVVQSEFPGGPSPYSPPWENGFDECFSTESMMPTYNPYYHVGPPAGAPDFRHIQTEVVEKGQATGGHRWRDLYWTGPGRFVDDGLSGDDSEAIMDRAVDFIQRKTRERRPFLALVWFHAPHTPIVAGKEELARYPGLETRAQHWFGAVSAMDGQIGRLRSELKRLGIEDDTILWFCSDNGPSYIHDYNSTGGLKGKKATLYEGGIRVPSILVWPRRIRVPAVSGLPVSTSDFYPTLLSICGAGVDGQPVLDGRDVLGLILSGAAERPEPIMFQSPVVNSAKKTETTEVLQSAVILNGFKLISVDGGNSFALFDLDADPGEMTDLSEAHPAMKAELKARLKDWQASCAESAKGRDYRRR